jgi:hypothetical protein
VGSAQLPASVSAAADLQITSYRTSPHQQRLEAIAWAGEECDGHMLFSCRTLTACIIIEQTRCWGAALQGICAPLPSCAAAAAEQPDGQSGQETTKRCLSCGNKRTLFYFPVRKAHPGGWVHCFACQREQWKKTKPTSRCVVIWLPVARWPAACFATCVQHS